MRKRNDTIDIIAAGMLIMMLIGFLVAMALYSASRDERRTPPNFIRDTLKIPTPCEAH